MLPTACVLPGTSSYPHQHSTVQVYRLREELPLQGIDQFEGNHDQKYSEIDFYPLFKVSQRTHKCPAQPPGTVIRQTGDLLQKLLQSSAILPTLQEQQQPSTASPPPAPPSSVETVVEPTPDDEDDATRSEDYINRTLDELLKESYDKMGISGDQSQLYAAMDGGSGGSSSSGGVGGESSVLVPRIENLCLMSPGPRGDLMSFDGESMEVIDSYKLDLLYN